MIQAKTQVKPAWIGAGAKVIFDGPVFVDPRAFIFGNCKVGAYSYFGRGDVVGSVSSIGRFCSIAPNVTIGLGEHPIDYVSTHPAFFGAAGMFPELKGVMGVQRTKEQLSFAPTIGNDVWIGTGAVVSRGVRVGDGAVIGAGAFVNKDVPDYAIVVGEPARVVRLRFPDSIVERLRALQWWRYGPEIMTGVDVSNIDSAICVLEDRVASGAYEAAVYQRTTYAG